VAKNAAARSGRFTMPWRRRNCRFLRVKVGSSPVLCSLGRRSFRLDRAIPCSIGRSGLPGSACASRVRRRRDSVRSEQASASRHRQLLFRFTNQKDFRQISTMSSLSAGWIEQSLLDWFASQQSLGKSPNLGATRLYRFGSLAFEREIPRNGALEAPRPPFLVCCGRIRFPFA
jgi:hypothetical protein